MWIYLKDKLPEYGKRVLVYDANSHLQDEPCRKTATLISKTESKNGIDYNWQVEQEPEKVETFKVWCDLPEIPKIK